MFIAKIRSFYEQITVHSAQSVMFSSEVYFLFTEIFLQTKSVSFQCTFSRYLPLFSAVYENRTGLCHFNDKGLDLTFVHFTKISQ